MRADEPTPEALRNSSPPPSNAEPAGHGARLRTQRLFELDFIDDDGYDALVERLLAPQPDDGLLPLVSTPNVDDIVRFSTPELHELRSMVRRSRYVIPDGQPIVWTSRLAGRPLSERLTGSSLFPVLWSRLVATGRRTLAVVSSDEIGDGLRAEHPELHTLVAPMFDQLGPDAMEQFVGRCVEVIDRERIEFLLVGIGSPRQQRIAAGCFDELSRRGVDAPVVLLLGASFAMHLGEVQRAPEWMQRAGLEWFHRFTKEPARLFRRYFVTDLAFAPMMLREVLAARRGREARD
jgi:N-acetylglucosaminyldiphosphoundecaprenol N-acetyl-beta-D-mannosaminyltransferase